MASRQVINSCLLVLFLSVTCNFRVEKNVSQCRNNSDILPKFAFGNKNVMPVNIKLCFLVTNSLTDVSNQL